MGPQLCPQCRHASGIFFTVADHTRAAYSKRMIFVELTPFIAFRTKQWNDEDLRRLQNFLLAGRTRVTSSPAFPVCANCAGLHKDAASAVARG